MRHFAFFVLASCGASQPPQAEPTRVEPTSDSPAEHAEAPTAPSEPSRALSAEARDYDEICHAVERSGAASLSDPARRAMHIANWLEPRITTQHARDTFQRTAEAPASARGGILRDAANDAGYAGPCPLADELPPNGP